MSRFWHLLAEFFPSHPFVNKLAAVNLDAQTTQIKIGSELLFNEPTCVTWQKNKQRVLNFGVSAYNLLGKTSDQVEVIFPLADNKVNQTNLLAVFLKSALAKASRHQTGNFKHLDVNLGVESGLSVSHANVLKQVAQKTPLVSTVRLVPRIEAAYQALLQQQKVDSQACLILFGEAVAEIGIFAEGRLVIANQVDLGKDKFIDLVREQVRVTHQLEIGRETAVQIWQEVAAIDVGTSDAKSAPKKKDLQMVIRGKHILTHLPTTAQVSSHDLIIGITAAMESLLQTIKLTFDQVSPELMGGLLEKGLMVTGFVNIRGLESYLMEKLHCPVVVSTTAQYDVLTGLLLAGQTRNRS